MATQPSLSLINDYFETLTGHIETGMAEQQRESGYQWNQLIQKNPFPLGMGEELTSFTLQRSGPTTPFSWTQLVINVPPPAAATGSNAIIQGSQINEASQAYTRGLFYGYVFSNPITLHDANLSVNWMEKLDYKVMNLQGNVSDIWENRKQDEYMRVSGHKVICQDSAPPETGFDQDWYPAAPDSQITLEYLKWGYNQMMRNGGRKGLDTVQGNPTPLVIIEEEGYEQIIYNNEGHRKDIRHSSKSDILLNPLGITDSLGPFKYVNNWRAPRYDYDAIGSTWIRRDFYTDEDVTLGEAQVNSLLYREAAYGVCHMFHPRVMELQVYSPKYSLGQAQFDASNWNGDFFWLNNKDNVNNIFGHVGYFGALLASSTKALEPDLAFNFMYRRCSQDFAALSCAGC